MSIKIKIIITIVVVSVLAVFIIWKWTFRKTDSSVASQKAKVEMEASALLQNFETNEDSANIKFLDKIIVVSGMIDNIIQDNEEISIYLKSSDDASGIMCSFDKKAINLASIKPGEHIKIKGKCSGYLMDVILKKCVIEK
jgi:hypothetical protein